MPFVLAIGLAFGKAVGAPEGFGMLTGKAETVGLRLWRKGSCRALAASLHLLLTGDGDVSNCLLALL